MKPKQTNLTVFAILTTLTLVTWALVEAYVRFYKVDIETVPSPIAAPINPTLDTTILDNLQQRLQLSESEIQQFSPKKSTPRPTSEPIVTTSSGTESTQSATESAAPQ